MIKLANITHSGSDQTVCKNGVSHFYLFNLCPVLSSFPTPETVAREEKLFENSQGEPGKADCFRCLR